MQEVKSLFEENVWLWQGREDEARETQARKLSMKLRRKIEAMGVYCMINLVGVCVCVCVDLYAVKLGLGRV